MGSSAYWAQWSHSEIMSMHGVEPYEANEDLDYDYDFEENVEENEDGCCCFCECMNSLGLSERDFM